MTHIRMEDFGHIACIYMKRKTKASDQTAHDLPVSFWPGSVNGLDWYRPVTVLRKGQNRVPFKLTRDLQVTAFYLT